MNGNVVFPPSPLPGEAIPMFTAHYYHVVTGRLMAPRETPEAARAAMAGCVRRTLRGEYWIADNIAEATADSGANWKFCITAPGDDGRAWEEEVMAMAKDALAAAEARGDAPAAVKARADIALARMALEGEI